MSTIYLVGSEDVRAAGNAMTHAANEMQRAAGTIESALDRHRMWMDDWLARLERVIEASQSEQPK